MSTQVLSAEPIGIAGAGRVAQAIGRLLREMGEPVTRIASRDPGHAREAARFIGGGIEAVPYADLPRGASRLLVAVSDAALDEVAQVLARTAVRGSVALHTCGTRGPEALAALRAAGVSCGVLHPLQTIPDPELGVVALRSCAFAVAGDDEGVRWAEQIAGLLEAEILHVLPGAWPLYHASAVMAGNYVVALMAAAEMLLAAATGGDSRAALRALSPLARAALENVFRCGPVDALTGPIERGDAATVARHLEALAGFPTRIRNLYRAAGCEALELARRKGLAAGTAAEIEAILERTKAE